MQTRSQCRPRTTPQTNSPRPAPPMATALPKGRISTQQAKERHKSHRQHHKGGNTPLRLGTTNIQGSQVITIEPGQATAPRASAPQRQRHHHSTIQSKNHRTPTHTTQQGPKNKQVSPCPAKRARRPAQSHNAGPAATTHDGGNAIHNDHHPAEGKTRQKNN